MCGRKGSPRTMEWRQNWKFWELEGKKQKHNIRTSSDKKNQQSNSKHACETSVSLSWLFLMSFRLVFDLIPRFLPVGQRAQILMMSRSLLPEEALMRRKRSLKGNLGRNESQTHAFPEYLRFCWIILRRILSVNHRPSLLQHMWQSNSSLTKQVCRKESKICGAPHRWQKHFSGCKVFILRKVGFYQFLKSVKLYDREVIYLRISTSLNDAICNIIRILCDMSQIDTVLRRMGFSVSKLNAHS